MSDNNLSPQDPKLHPDLPLLRNNMLSNTLHPLEQNILPPDQQMLHRLRKHPLPVQGDSVGKDQFPLSNLLRF